ncbi:MAG: transcription elongation factor [Planctomycetia bacterium]|nr:transcription elongation factor [Planctomycetia bacterium]
MPEKKTIERAKRDKREGKSASTQAGEFVRETIEHIRQGKHGARSTKQAIAIGLSKARRAGVDLPPPKEGKTSEKTRRSAASAYRAGHAGGHKKVNPRRSKAVTKALQREGHNAASTRALSRQASQQAAKRTAAEKSASARKAARTRLAHQTPVERRAIARKAARTRKSHHAAQT